MEIDTAVILCGGRGSRFVESVRYELRASERRVEDPRGCSLPSPLPYDFLRELETTPKCLLPLKGKPLIVHKMHQLKEAGIRRFALCAGRNAGATIACLREHHLDRDFDITVFGTSLFRSGDLSDIARAAKAFGSPQHLLVTAGDCITTSNYLELCNAHLANNRYLTICLTTTETQEVFVQDSAISAQFLETSVSNSSHAQRRFPACSPYLASVRYAWHKGLLLEHNREIRFVNINTLSDFEKLIELQDVLRPAAIPPRPSLAGFGPEPGPRTISPPLQP